jgi:hypothetical protein
MTSAEDAMSFIKSKFAFQQVSDEQIEVVLDTGEGRTQSVFCYTTKDLIVFESPFALVTEVSSEDVLKFAQEYPVGVNLSGPLFIVRHIIPLIDSNESEILTAFTFVSTAGDDLEKDLSRQDRF